MKNRILQFFSAMLATLIVLPTIFSAGVVNAADSIVSEIGDMIRSKGSFSFDGSYIVTSIMTAYGQVTAIVMSERGTGDLLLLSECDYFDGGVSIRIDVDTTDITEAVSYCTMEESNVAFSYYIESFSKSYNLYDELVYSYNDAYEGTEVSDPKYFQVNDSIVAVSVMTIDILLQNYKYSLGDLGFDHFAYDGDRTESGGLSSGNDNDRDLDDDEDEEVIIIIDDEEDDDTPHGSSASGTGSGSVILTPAPTSTPAVTDVAIDSTNFPDNAFRAYVEHFDVNRNGYLDVKELIRIDDVVISDSTCGVVKSLKGIEFFTSLTKLNCSNSSVTSLDLSHNRKLAVLIAHDSKLKDVNLEKTLLSTKTLTKDTNKNYFIAHDDNTKGTLFDIDDKVSVSYLSYLVVLNKDVTINGLKVYSADDNSDAGVNVGGEVIGMTTATPTPIATPTPEKEENTNTGNPEDTTKPTVTPAPDKSSESVEAFAERLYTTCLGRDAEKEGVKYWASELKSGKSGAEVADGFFFSPEFTKKNLSNKEFITRLYRTFMGREPDADGIKYWSDVMKFGQDRRFVFSGFINSPEWADICLKYGIRSGGTAKPSFEKKASAEVKAFAERLYTTCLGREAEEAGLDYWAQELANLRQTGTVAAQGFFFSAEFEGLHLENKEYITRLYRTFMGREPDTAGFNYWLKQMKQGQTRVDVFNGFAGAPEFAELCASSGIMR